MDNFDTFQEIVIEMLDDPDVQAMDTPCISLWELSSYLSKFREEMDNRRRKITYGRDFNIHTGFPEVSDHK